MTMRPEVQLLLATIHRATGRRYPELSRLLENTDDKSVLQDVARLARDLGTALQHERREGNRDAWLRGRFVP